MIVSRAKLARLKAQIANVYASALPLCVVLEPQDGESVGAWADRVREAQARADEVKATGRRAFVILIDGAGGAS